MDVQNPVFYLTYQEAYTNEQLEHAIRACIPSAVIKHDASDIAEHLDTSAGVWGEYEHIPWELVYGTQERTGGYPIVNYYATRKGLIRKAQLAYCVRKYSSKCATSILHQHVPLTFYMEVSNPLYIEDAIMEYMPELLMQQPQQQESEDAAWILKPSITNQAFGIHLFRDGDELMDYFLSNCEDSSSEEEEEEEEAEDEEEEDNQVEEAANEEEQQRGAESRSRSREPVEQIRDWVIQQYIQPPFLIDQRKFHLRVYCCCIGNLQVYCFDRVLVLFASVPYQSDLSNRAAHITNTCAQQQYEQFVEERDVREIHELELEFGGAQSVAQILQQVHDVTAELFHAVLQEPIHFQPRQASFEVFGLDFLVDAKRNVWFLEANAGPNFVMTGRRLQDSVCGRFLHRSATLALHQLAPKLTSCTDDADDAEFVLVYEKAAA